jgi:Terpene synthase family 2, C-terminal metal binding
MFEEWELPKFYEPFPAAVSPCLEEVRPQLLEWARTVGIVVEADKATAPGVWSEEDFKATDFTKFTALTHPYTSADELALLACWYAATWHIDDLIVPARGPLLTREKALRWARQAMSFLQVVPGPVPAPESPLEAALADMWARTIPSASQRWRARYHRSYREFLEGLAWEVGNLSHTRSADLIQQLEMRRDYGASLTGALLTGN